MLRWISGLVLGSVLIGGALAPSTAQAGQWVDRGGYSYYVGDDGRWYYYDLAGNCYVWDGVAWRLYQPASRRYVEPYPADGYADYGYADYGYVQPYYGAYSYGYVPYRRSYAYVAPFGGYHHDHTGHYYGGVLGEHHGGVGHSG